MLNDLFSHKIHASDLEDWKRKIVKLAYVFQSFDNQTFNRERFDQALNFLSPTAARSPFRDIYSIYISILGVGRIVWEEGIWKCHISETARRYLIGDEPNVEAFCRLQLSLYQRLDGRGQQYTRSGLNLEHQTQQMTLALIINGYRVSPLRLILKIFEAKARLQGCLQDEILVMPEEIYSLVNCQDLRSNPFASIEQVTEALNKYNNLRFPIVQGEKRFAFLEATGLLKVERGNNLRLYPYSDYVLNRNRDLQIAAIKSLDYFFGDFNQCTNIDQICQVLISGGWANYFDAYKTLSAQEVKEIAGEITISQTLPPPETLVVQSTTPLQPSLLPLPRKIETGSRKRSNQHRQAQAIDPESTKILRERRNAWHDLLVQKMRDCIEQAGLEPWETDLIDVGVDLENINQIYQGGFTLERTYLEEQNLPYFDTDISEGLTFLFEMKSSDNSIIVEQVRKAVSQLYEYRYRYFRSGQIKKNAVLVIVLQQFPDAPAWLKDYLLLDRRIAVCWLREDNSRFDCFDECKPILEPLITC
ncbi:MAG: hypothetical protein WBG73_09015 [Coleofasciculaceae cyanobacterium]